VPLPDHPGGGFQPLEADGVSGHGQASAADGNAGAPRRDTSDDDAFMCCIAILKSSRTAFAMPSMKGIACRNGAEGTPQGHRRIDSGMDRQLH
jgi:hypothetical protein